MIHLVNVKTTWRAEVELRALMKRGQTPSHLMITSINGNEMVRQLV